MPRARSLELRALESANRTSGCARPESRVRLGGGWAAKTDRLSVRPCLDNWPGFGKLSGSSGGFLPFRLVGQVRGELMFASKLAPLTQGMGATILGGCRRI